MDMDKFYAFLKDGIKPVSLAIIDYILNNVDKLDFGSHNFLMKGAIRIFFTRLQTAFINSKSVDWVAMKDMMIMYTK